MALFDFLDLNGETGAWDMTAAAVPQITQGLRQGEQDVRERELALAKQLEVDRKMGLDAFEIQQKVKQLPMDEILKAQKINILTSEPTVEQNQAAALEILGPDKSKWESATEQDLEKVSRRAEELARASVPKLGSDDFLDYARSNAVSDSTIERIKAKEQMELALRKEDLKNQRLRESLGVSMRNKDESIKATASQNDKNRALKDKLAKEKAEQREQEKNDKRAQDLFAAFKKTRGRYAANLFKNGKPADVDGIKAMDNARKAIQETGSSKTLREFDAMFADDVQFIITAPPPVPKGKPKSATETVDKINAQKAIENHQTVFARKEANERERLRKLENDFKIFGGQIPRNDAIELDRLRARYGKQKASSERRVIKGVTYEKVGTNWVKVK